MFTKKKKTVMKALLANFCVEVVHVCWYAVVFKDQVAFGQRNEEHNIRLIQEHTKHTNPIVLIFWMVNFWSD